MKPLRLLTLILSTREFSRVTIRTSKVVSNKHKLINIVGLIYYRHRGVGYQCIP